MNIVWGRPPLRLWRKGLNGRLVPCKFYLNLLCGIALLFITKPVYTQWSTDPANNLIVGYGLLPEICSDSVGGAYVTYENNTVYPRKIELRRIDRYGYQPWNDSRFIVGELPESRYASIVPDGSNGVIISYLEREQYPPPYNGLYKERLRVQRIDSNGILLWGNKGVRVLVPEHNQSSAQYASVISDNHGGCLVLWIDTLQVFRMQRIDSKGFRMWGDSGIYVDSAIYGYTDNLLVINGNHDEFFIGYASNIFSLTSILQKINLNGDKLWGNGISLDFLLKKISLNHNQEVVCSGRKASGLTALIVAEKIDSMGIKRWNQPYVVLAESTDINTALVPICVLSDNSSVFAWIRTINDTQKVFTQRLSIDGIPLWNHSGISISQMHVNQINPRMVLSNNDEVIFSWLDSRNSIYAQKIDTSGRQTWSMFDVNLSSSSINEMSKQFISDLKGGFIGCWSSSNFGICIQQVNGRGQLGEVITDVSIREAKFPNSILLYQNYPNPFNGSTIIKYTINQSTFVRLDVVDILGKHLQTLVDQVQYPNTYSVLLDANSFVSGVYFYVLHSYNNIQVRNFTILK